MFKQTAEDQPANTQLDIDSFLKNDRIKNCLERLNEKFNAPGSKPLIVSDTLDEFGHQYVNLVQKGGGVLGIALVGYTYILEEMGIRFLRLAGTSAGAINTALMTVIGKKEDPKSVQVLDVICKLDFFKLVDGHPVVRWLIKNFITHQDFSVKLKSWVIGLIGILGIFLVGDFVFLGLETKYHNISVITELFFVFTGILLLLIIIIVAYIVSLLKRLKDSGFGINPGNYFYDWIKTQLIANGVKTVSDLKNKAGAPIPGLHLRVDHPEGVKDLDGDVTFITSEVVTENKIQFPEMCALFRQEKDIEQLQPAGFIRASMAIPVFFESYFINDIPCNTQEIKDAWKDTFNVTDPPQAARFVDGGILSNFPMDIFYNPKINVPRLPTFGIDLDDTKPEDQTKHAADWSLFGYFGRIFNTVRFYYDKDFLLKNKMFEMGIGKVLLSKYNWLNFFLQPDEKTDMFLTGAEAATNFLLNFDWEAYKLNRSETQKQL